MSLTSRQYQSLHLASCHVAEELPPSQHLNSLAAIYEAGRLLHMTKTKFVGLLGSVAVRCVTGEVDDGGPAEAPCSPPTPGAWPRLVKQVAYEPHGNLQIGGIDDNNIPRQENPPAAPSNPGVLRTPSRSLAPLVVRSGLRYNLSVPRAIGLHRSL